MKRTRAGAESSLALSGSAPRNLRPFPFLSLPLSLQQRIVNLRTLDLPTLVSASMTSRASRKSFWPFKHGSYNNWRFLDECARLGYFELLKFARDNGSRLDGLVLLAAIRSNHIEIAKWLTEHLPPSALNEHESLMDSPETIRFQCLKLILAKDIKDLLEFFVTSLPIPQGFLGAKMLKQLGEAAAEGGNSRSARKYSKDFDIEQHRSGGRYQDPPNLKASASKGGHLSVALEFCALFNAPTANEIKDIIHGAIEGGQYDIIRYALKSPGAYAVRPLDFTAISALPGPRAVQAFSSVYLKYTDLQKSMVSWLIATPQIDILHFLAEQDAFKGLSETDRATLPGIIFNAGEKVLAENPSKVEEVKKSAGIRFSCVKYLLKSGAIKGWSLKDIEGAMCWASWEQAKFIIEKSSDKLSEKTALVLLSAHLKSNFVADLDLVSYLVEKCQDIPKNEFFRMALLENNFALFERLYPILVQRGTLTNAFAMVKELLVYFDLVVKRDLKSKGTFNFDFYTPSPDNVRPRIHSFLSLFFWFVDVGLEVTLEINRLLRAVRSLHFQVEVDEVVGSNTA